MESFHTRLLNWYDEHARNLPWRVSPKDLRNGIIPDPYHVWLSEVMLQQTTVATVKDYFNKFIALWPSLPDLAAAETDEIMRAWAGLGYYSRARNLKSCADRVASDYDGQFPNEQNELLKLPGIGDYTSAAITTIAYGNMAPVVDGNIERVVTRHTANATPLPKAKADCRKFMVRETPAEQPGNFVQAMMDLGATVCMPKNPACSLCPVSSDCQAAQAGTMLNYPVKPPKRNKPTRKGAAFVIEREDGAVLLLKRPDRGLLGGMAGLPTTQWTASKDGLTGVDALPFDAQWCRHGEIRHTFTHFHLELEVWHAIANHNPQTGWWSSRPNLQNEALPTVMKKAISAVFPNTFN